MPRCKSHGWFVCVVLAAGCAKPAPPPYPEWTPRRAAFAPSPSSGNAFDGYVMASREAAEAAVIPASGDIRERDLSEFVSFNNVDKRRLIERLAPALRRFRRASQMPCDYRFASLPPTETDPNAKGWRLIRYSLVWQIESAVKNGDFGTAVNLACLATKAGFDLSAGGSGNADVGLQFADDARRVIAPHLARMTPAQLSQLTAGLKRALDALPKFETIAQNESENFLASVDWVQSLYRAGKFEEIDDYLGPSVRDATSYLKGVAKEDRSRRPAYFQGFAREAEETADWFRSQSALPVAKRKKDEAMPLAKFRPWKRYSAALFGTLKPILNRYDDTLARTRLLALTGEVYRQIKVARAAPRTLDAFSSEMTTDPYTGLPFKYRATGVDFFIYSVGPNLRDDQGETDGSFASPDLTLEVVRG